MNCKICSESVDHILDLVKDGTVYRAFRCSAGHHVVRDMRQDRLPIEMEIQDGVQLARVECGDNCCIFDRKMFRSALRRVFRGVRGHEGHLILDLSQVSLVADGLLSAIGFLDNGLARRKRSLLVVAPSAPMQSHLLSTAPRLIGRIYRNRRDAIGATQPMTVQGATERLALA